MWLEWALCGDHFNWGRSFYIFLLIKTFWIWIFNDLEESIGSSGFVYTGFSDKIDKIDSEISGLKFRVNAIPDNALTEQQVVLLQQNFDLVKDDIKHLTNYNTTTVGPTDSGVIRAFLQMDEDAMDSICSAILKLELAKRDMRLSHSGAGTSSSQK